MDQVVFCIIHLLCVSPNWIFLLRKLCIGSCQVFFKEKSQVKLSLHYPNLKIKTRWGQLYDVDQLFEHAIVHVLRHRRQIERFIVKLKENSK